jgi:hypothetical protein
VTSTRESVLLCFQEFGERIYLSSRGLGWRSRKPGRIPVTQLMCNLRWKQQPPAVKGTSHSPRRYFTVTSLSPGFGQTA